MNKIDRQTFDLDRWLVRLSYFGIWFFAAFAILSIGLAIFEIIQNPENKGALVVYLLMALLFAGFAYAGYRMTRQFGRAPVSVDEDGLWPVSLGKSDGLVRWEDIGSIRERQYGQRLELLDRDGSSLIKLEYQLVGFETLRQIVLAKIRRSDSDIDCPAIFKKSIGYHIFTILAIIGFTALAYYAGQERPVLGLLLFGVVVLLSVNDYVRTVAKLTINRRNLDIRYPLRNKIIDLSEVSSIYLTDQFVKATRHPEVVVESHTDRKPIRLKQLGIDALALYDLLDRWKNERLFG